MDKEMNKPAEQSMPAASTPAAAPKKKGGMGIVWIILIIIVLLCCGASAVLGFVYWRNKDVFNKAFNDANKGANYLSPTPTSGTSDGFGGSTSGTGSGSETGTETPTESGTTTPTPTGTTSGSALEGDTNGDGKIDDQELQKILDELNKSQ